MGGGTEMRTVENRSVNAPFWTAYSELPLKYAGPSMQNAWHPYPWVPTGTGAFPGNVGEYRNLFTGKITKTPWNEPFQSSIAPLSQEHDWALKGLTTRAMQGSPVTNAASKELIKTIQGSYLNPESNPYLRDMYNVASGDVTRQWQNATLPSLKSAMNRAGAFGGSTAQLLEAESGRGLGENLANMATEMYGKNYADERARQMQAQLFAPTMAATDYTDLQALMGVGDVRRQYKQDQMNELMNWWNQANEWPWTQAGKYSSLLPNSTAGTGVNYTQSQMPVKQNASLLSQILGGAMTGLGLLTAPFTGGTSALGSLFSLLGGGGNVGSGLFSGSTARWT